MGCLDTGQWEALIDIFIVSVMKLLLTIFIVHDFKDSFQVSTFFVVTVVNNTFLRHYVTFCNQKLPAKFTCGMNYCNVNPR